MARLLLIVTMLTIYFQFSCSLPDAERRVKRHADGLFTSELSKIKNDFAMRSYLRSLLISKRSASEGNLSNNSEETEDMTEAACFNWLYQSFLSKSLSDNEALEVTQESYKLICRPLGHLVVSLTEYIPFTHSFERKQ